MRVIEAAAYNRELFIRRGYFGNVPVAVLRLQSDGGRMVYGTPEHNE